MNLPLSEQQNIDSSLSMPKALFALSFATISMSFILFIFIQFFSLLVL